MDKLPYIFDRFYQADDDNTREFEGTGIGLALVKELVELHHGEVLVQSVLNGETTFTVRLPLGRAHLRDDQIAESAEMPAEETLPDFEFPRAEGVPSEKGQASIEHPASSIQHPASSIEHPASSIEYRASSIQYRTTNSG
jgi:hypothetical protein